MSNIKLYQITLGFEIQSQRASQNIENKAEIPVENVQTHGDFEFSDYKSKSTIGHLKEYFLLTFCQKKASCKCLIWVYYKNRNTYHILSKD